jgi:hypothetical protein
MTKHEQAIRKEFKRLLKRYLVVILNKLMANERKYKWNGAWRKQDWEDSLQRQMLEHVHKGDGRDTTILSFFAWVRGWSVGKPKDAWTNSPVPKWFCLLAEAQTELVAFRNVAARHEQYKINQTIERIDACLAEANLTPSHWGAAGPYSPTTATGAADDAPTIQQLPNNGTRRN